jgi:serine acetyltransferase
MIAAGSVVSSPVGADVSVAGNPSRFVRKLESSLERASQ